MMQMTWIRALFESCLREIDRWCPHLKHTKYRIGPLTSAKIQLNKRCILISISFWLTTSKTKCPRGKCNQPIYLTTTYLDNLATLRAYFPSKECLKHSDLLLESDDDSDASQDSSVWAFVCDQRYHFRIHFGWQTVDGRNRAPPGMYKTL